MDTVDYAVVLRGTLALAGIGSTEGQADVARLRQFHDQRLRQAWQHGPWPELMRVEQRQYRQTWASATAYVAGDERFYPPTLGYYVALRPSTGQTPADAAGNENSAYWAELDSGETTATWTAGRVFAAGDRTVNPADLLTYKCHTAHTAGASFDATKFGAVPEFIRDIDSTQSWESTVLGDVMQVWDRNPRTNQNAREVEYEVEDDRIIVLEGDVPRPWVQYRLRVPQLTGEPYSATTTYATGRQLYYESSTASGNFYDVLSATSEGETPESASAKFRVVEIPRTFTNYLIQGAYADWMPAEGDGAERRAIEQARAERLLGDEWMRVAAQLNQRGRYRVRVRGY